MIVRAAAKKRRIPSGPPRLAAVFLLLGALGSALAGTAEAPARFSLTVAAGLFRPSSADVRAVYGSTAWPLLVQVGWRFAGPVSIFAGYRSVRLSGTTVVVGPSFVDERYSLRLTNSSWRGGLQLATAAGSWNFRCYGGAAYVSYKETWSGAAISTAGQATGFLIGGGIDYAIGRRLALTAAVEFETVPTTGNGRLTSKPQLGGIDVFVGASLRF